MHHSAERILLARRVSSRGYAAQADLRQQTGTLRNRVGAGVDREVRLAIQRFARIKNVLQVLHRFTAAGHRTQVTLGHHALHVVLWRRFEPNGITRGEQSLERGWFRDQATAGCKHESRVAFDKVVETAALQSPEARLPVQFKDHSERDAGLLFDQAIQLKKWDVEARR